MHTCAVRPALALSLQFKVKMGDKSMSFKVKPSVKFSKVRSPAILHSGRLALGSSDSQATLHSGHLTHS